jgi:hypothetical protein
MKTCQCINCQFKNQCSGHQISEAKILTESTIKNVVSYIHCKKCPKKFTSEVRLNHHFEHNHVTKRSFTCIFCKNTYRFKSRLWNHTLKFHPDKDFTENIKPETKYIQGELTTVSKKKSIFHYVELMAISDSSGQQKKTENKFHFVETRRLQPRFIKRDRVNSV